MILLSYYNKLIPSSWIQNSVPRLFDEYYKLKNTLKSIWVHNKRFVWWIYLDNFSFKNIKLGIQNLEYVGKWQLYTFSIF